MIIANPIYDVVFKYLMEDLDIARELLSLIIGEEIVTLTVKPQESIVEVSGGMRVFRYDFKAVVQQADGSHKKILIELQKAKVLLDVTRFRQYLGDNYSKEDRVFNDATGKLEGQTLLRMNWNAPIIRICEPKMKLLKKKTRLLKKKSKCLKKKTKKLRRYEPKQKKQVVKWLKCVNKWLY